MWKTAFTIPTEKQCCLERATQVGRSHTFAIVAMIKSRILAATIQVGYSYLFRGKYHIYIGTVQCNVYMYANRSEEWWL